MPIADFPVPAFLALVAQGLGQISEGHRLYDDPARTGQCRHEQALSAEQRCLYSSDGGDVVSHGLLPCHGVSCGHLVLLAGCEVDHVQVAACMDERTSRSGQPLKDQPLASEQHGAHPLLQGHVQLDRGLGAEISGLLDDPRTLSEVQVQDLSGRLAGETYGADPALGRVLQKEQGRPGEGALQTRHEPALHLGLHPHVSTHVCHRPGHGVELLSGLQLDVDELQVVSSDGVFHCRTHDVHRAPPI